MIWVTCEVTRAGPAEDGTIYIALRKEDGSWNRWFIAFPAMENEMLATALASMNMNKRVIVWLTGEAAYSTINRLYVAK